MTKGTVNVKNGNTQIAKVSPKQELGNKVKDLIQSKMGDIAKSLPSVITPERFTRMAFTAIANNDKLLMSTQTSIIGALFVAAQLGLEPNTPLGQAYIVPYKNQDTGQMEATFQLGYKGLIDLAHRSGELKSLQAHMVYANDEFEYQLGLEPTLRHIPSMGDRGEKKCVYAVYHLKSGGYAFEVMSVKDINDHRNKFSKAKNSPAWTTSWEEMAKKTVIKKALKYAPMKSDFIKAVAMDEQKIKVSDNTLGEETYFDGEPEVEVMEVESEVVEEKATQKKPAKQEESKPVETEGEGLTEDEIEADMPDFLKDTE